MSNDKTLSQTDVMSNWLYAEPVEPGAKRPSFRFRVRGNVPNLIVKTGIQNDKNFGTIEFRTDLPNFATILHCLETLITNPEQGDYNFTYEDDYVAGKKLDNKMVLCTCRIGRDRESQRIYLSLLSSDRSRPKIQFFFGPAARFHNLTHGDGSPLAPKALSEAYTGGFIKSMSWIVAPLLHSLFDPDGKNVAKAMAPGGGGGGGQQQRGNGGGGNNYQQRGNGGGQQQSGGGNSGGDAFDDFGNF
jgi:hypothetical protein